MARLVYDHNAVLDRWARGEPVPVIAAACGIRTMTGVYAIVSRARGKGDPRAYKRPPSPLQTWWGRDETRAYWEAEAEARGLEVGALLARVVEVIADDDMLSAVLDDEP